MADDLAHLIQMANDIANFCKPSNPGDFEAGAQATATHMKKFWHKTMRQKFSEQGSDLTNKLSDTARRAAYILWEEINA